MRCFLGFELSAEVREAIGAVQERLRHQLPSARWVRPVNLHLTLRFLGEQGSERVSAFVRDLRDPVAACDRFSLEFRGCDAFPNAKRARVVWVGAHDPDRALGRLRASVDRSLQRSGLEREKRPFAPHLTIARFKKGRKPESALEALISALADHRFGEVAIRELVLFESDLSSRGVRYQVVERFGLSGKV